MPFNYNPSQVPFKLTAEESGSASPNYAQELAKGFQIGMTPKMMLDEMLKNKLINQLQAAKAKYAESNEQAANQQALVQSRYAEPLTQANLNRIGAQTGLTQAQIGLTNANVNKIPWEIKLLQAQQQRALMPTLTDEAKAADSLEKLGLKYGKDSDIYKDAKKSYQTNIKSKEGLISYREDLQKYLPKSRATNFGKKQLELDEINNGFLPGSNGTIKLSPDEQNIMQEQLQLSIQKDVSDVDARKKSIFASNIDKTLNNINVKDLTQYGGLSGQITKKLEEGKALTGKESEKYRDYQRSLTAANLLAKQVRQFYGDSITPQVQEKLSLLTNPASWTNNPRIAEQNFNQFKNILQQETETYRSSLHSTKEFQEKPQQQQTIQIRNKKTGEIKSISIEEARKLGVPNV